MSRKEKRGKPALSQVEKVLHYYYNTRNDYKFFWMSSKSLAMHFGYYDETVRTHEASLLKMNAVLAGYAQITAQTHVLDAGCGYGGSAIWLAATYGCQVHGINISPYEIQEAQHFARVRRVSHLVQFEVMDYTQITYPDASFDVIWALETLVHTEHRPAFIQQVHRLLRPGGRLLISEYLLREHPPLSEEELAFLTPMIEGFAMTPLITVDDYRRLLADDKFRLQTYDLTDHVRRSIDHLGNLRLPTIPTIPILLKIAPALQTCHLLSAERINNYKAGPCMNYALHRGLWQYIVIVAEKM
jgi:tocopherol O-methyltransferase